VAGASFTSTNNLEISDFAATINECDMHIYLLLPHLALSAHLHSAQVALTILMPRSVSYERQPKTKEVGSTY